MKVISGSIDEGNFKLIKAIKLCDNYQTDQCHILIYFYESKYKEFVNVDRVREKRGKVKEEKLKIFCVFLYIIRILYIFVYVYKTYTNVYTIVIITFHNI